MRAALQQLICCPCLHAVLSCSSNVLSCYYSTSACSRAGQFCNSLSEPSAPHPASAGSISLWDAASQQAVEDGSAHRAAATALAWSSNGAQLASGDSNGKVMQGFMWGASAWVWQWCMYVVVLCALGTIQQCPFCLAVLLLAYIPTQHMQHREGVA